MRASDAEREATAARIHHALGEGRLDLAEAETRIASAYAARYRDELPPLLADLPESDRVAAGAPAWSALWVSAVWRARTAVLGAAGSETAPTARQCRVAARLVALAVLWVTVCAFLGALVVAA
jgi:hypothetical protein